MSAAAPSCPTFRASTRSRYLTNTSILQLTEVPRHLIVIGGSYIGLEFAQAYRRFGAQVTVVEKGPRIVGREDEDVSAALQEILEKEGIAFRLNAECIRFAQHPDGIAAGVDCDEGPPDVIGSHVLLAVGRQPNTDDLGLDAAGVATDAQGYVTVNDKLETNVPGIWAMGDCNRRGAFTHTSYNDYEIVAANLLDGDDRKVSDRLPCYGLFTDPPLGRVGMGEAEAKAKGHRILVGKRPMTRVGRAVEKGEAQGFMKIVVDAEQRRDPRRRDPRPRRRRGGALHPRHDADRSDRRRDAPHRAHPPDRRRAHPDHRRRAQTGLRRAASYINHDVTIAILRPSAGRARTNGSTTLQFIHSFRACATRRKPGVKHPNRATTQIYPLVPRLGWRHYS